MKNALRISLLLIALLFLLAWRFAPARQASHEPEPSGEVRRPDAAVPDHTRTLRVLHGGAVETQNDHRLAMSAATAACAATGEITVDNDGCVAKSYPRFWEDFSSLKGEGL